MGDGAAFGDEVALDHTLAMKLEDAALGEASPQRFPHLCRVRSSPLRQQRCLGNCSNGYTDDDLIGNFASWPAP